MALTACCTLLCGRGIVRHSVAKALPAVTRCRGSIHVRSAAAIAPSTKVRYAKRADKKDLFYYTTPPEDQDKFTNLEPEDVAVELTDLRTNNEMQWQRNGFELVQLPHAQNIAWEDREQVWHLDLGIGTCFVLCVCAAVCITLDLWQQLSFC